MEYQPALGRLRLQAEQTGTLGDQHVDFLSDGCQNRVGFGRRVEHQDSLVVLDHEQSPAHGVEAAEVGPGEGAVHGRVVEDRDPDVQRPGNRAGAGDPLRRGLAEAEEGGLERHSGPERELDHVERVGDRRSSARCR